jgi:hypothetical protein
MRSTRCLPLLPIGLRRPAGQQKVVVITAKRSGRWRPEASHGSSRLTVSAIAVSDEDESGEELSISIRIATPGPALIAKVPTEYALLGSLLGIGFWFHFLARIISFSVFPHAEDPPLELELIGTFVPLQRNVELSRRETDGWVTSDCLWNHWGYLGSNDYWTIKASLYDPAARHRSSRSHTTCGCCEYTIYIYTYIRSTTGWISTALPQPLGKIAAKNPQHLGSPRACKWGFRIPFREKEITRRVSYE